jgi:transcriptional regulator
MYVPVPFRIDEEACLAFAAARGFGLVVANDDGRPVASHLPFLLRRMDGVTQLEFHVARANPLAMLAERGGSWLVAVQGHDAYVAPGWYASAEQVPTWLYEAVHLTGRVSVMAQNDLAASLDRLSMRFEAPLAGEGSAPWSLARLSARRRDMLLQAIVGIALTVETVEGSFKLNQHKTDADHVAIANALAHQDDHSSQAIAERMKGSRPHLDYERALTPL